MENKLEIKVEEGVKTLVIREGDAETIHQDEKVEIMGAINTAWQFYKERMNVDTAYVGGIDEPQNNVKRCHLVFSYQNKYINLILVENNPIKYVIKGKLIENPDIKKLQVNTQRKFTSKDLCQMLRFNKYFFADKEENGTLITNLQKTKMSIQTNIEKNHDQVGNKKDLYDVQVDTKDTKLSFDLSLPLFIGQPATKFKVDICIDVREREIEFWLESAELAELLEAKTREIIDAELLNFKDKGLVIIEQ